jgi:hypothetical protein
VAISLESTVESCCIFYILFFSHSSTNILEGLEGIQSFWQKSSSEISWKTKGNTPAEQFGRRSIYLSSSVGSCSFLDMWCTEMLPSFKTVEIGNALSGKVSGMLNSSSSIFRLARFYSDLGRSIQPLDHFYFKIYCAQLYDI